jgi:polyhydroxyalkanoate synthesis regulator phasin
MFKRYEEAGEEFIESARSKAVEFLKELSQLGEATQRHAQEQVGDLVDMGRSRSDALIDTIRNEIRIQLSQLGLVIRADDAALERRTAAPADKAGAATDPAVTKTTAKKTAPAKKAAAARKTTGASKKTAPAGRTAPANTAAAKKNAPAKKTAAEKTAAKKTAAKKTVAKKTAAEKTGAKRTAAEKKSAATKASGATAKS